MVWRRSTTGRAAGSSAPECAAHSLVRMRPKHDSLDPPTSCTSAIANEILKPSPPPREEWSGTGGVEREGFRQPEDSCPLSCTLCHRTACCTVTSTVTAQADGPGGRQTPPRLGRARAGCVPVHPALGGRAMDAWSGATVGGGDGRRRGVVEGDGERGGREGTGPPVLRPNPGAKLQWGRRDK
jgi:hypothetical protein